MIKIYEFIINLLGFSEQVFKSHFSCENLVTICCFFSYGLSFMEGYSSLAEEDAFEMR